MYLVYIYNSFIFTIDTFIYVFIRFKLVLEHLGGRMEGMHISGKTSLTC